MKKMIAVILCAVSILLCAGCESQVDLSLAMEPQADQMRSICELAVMDCYYHNVAKYKQEDSAGFWIFKKDTHFWVEYAGIVSVGVDVNQVKISVDHSDIYITIPKAKILNCTVDSSSLTNDSYIVDKKSAKITPDDEKAAFAQAQEKMRENAVNDTILFSQAQEQVKTMLGNYIMTISEVTGKEYTIHWTYLDSESSDPS